MKDELKAEKPRPIVLLVLVLVAIASISTASILVRLAEAPSLSIAAYRCTLATVFLSPVFARRFRSSVQELTPRLIGFIVLSGLFLAFHFASWIQSLEYTSVASSATLVSTTPLFVAIFSYLWLSERPKGQLWLGILCVLTGSIFVAGKDFSFSLRALAGDVLAIAGALMATGYLLTGRVVRRTLNLSAYPFLVFGTAAVMLITLTLLTGTPFFGFSTKTYAALILLALIPQLIGHTTFNWTLRFLSPTAVAILILGEPIGASILAYFFLGETVTGTKAVGLVVLGAGILLSSLAIPESKPTRTTPVQVDTGMEKQ